MDETNVIALDTGSVEHSLKDAVISIDEMIGMMEAAKSEGAEHVVFLSGNHRGARYVRAPYRYEWLEDL